MTTQVPAASPAITLRLSPQFLPTLILSLSLACALSAAGCAAAWYAGTRISRYHFVRYDDIGHGLLAAAIAWILLQIPLWHPATTTRLKRLTDRYHLSHARAVALTGLLAVLGAYAAYYASSHVYRNHKVVMSVVLLVTAAAAIAMWSLTLRTPDLRRPMLTPDDIVDVRCPHCDYLLVGLRETRCPECGAQFTIDELFRRQNFAPPAASSSA